MRKKLENLLKERTSTISFLRILKNSELELKKYNIPQNGIDIPILNESLVESVKNGKAMQGLYKSQILEGIINIIGIDPLFVWNNEYKKILSSIDQNIEKYIGKKALEFAKEEDLIQTMIYLRCILFLNPSSLKANFNLALTCNQMIEKNEYKSLKEELIEYEIELLENIIKNNIDFLPAYDQLGYVYFELKNNYLKAQTLWQKAFDLGLKEERIILDIEKCKKKIKIEEAIEQILEEDVQNGLNKLLDLAQEFEEDYRLMFFIGLGYRYTGFAHEAIKYFIQASYINPLSADPFNELGLCRALIGDNQGAKEEFKKALYASKDDFEVMCNLGMLYLQEKDLKNAKKYIFKANSLAPDDEITKLCMYEVEKFEDQI